MAPVLEIFVFWIIFANEAGSCIVANRNEGRRMKRSKLIGVGLLVLFLALTAWAGPTPPKNLKQLGPDHWTPWDPPAAEPGDYIIQRGDTLWDLAGAWLGDPYLWPLVWEQNRYIQDSHWIYPGDPLKVPGEPTVVPEEGPPETAEVDPGYGAGDDDGDDDMAEIEPAPLPLFPIADANDVYCSGYIDAYHEPASLRIQGHELERQILGTGDVIYLGQGSDAGIEPGSSWGVIRVTRSVKHPKSQDELGDYVRRLGKVRIMAVQEHTSLAVIEMSCEDIRFDDELVAWSEIPIPSVAQLPTFDRYAIDPNGKPTGFVVAGKDPVRSLGQGHIIHMDLGESTVSSGEVVTLYRPNGDNPRLVLGQAVVLTAEQESATLRITDSVREIMIGDRVEVR